MGEKECSVGTVLFRAGDQVPLKPLFDMVGKFNKISPSQIGFIVVNVGVIAGLTVIKTYSVVTSPQMSVLLTVKVVVTVGANVGLALLTPIVWFQE